MIVCVSVIKKRIDAHIRLKRPLSVQIYKKNLKYFQIIKMFVALCFVISTVRIKFVVVRE